MTVLRPRLRVLIAALAITAIAVPPLAAAVVAAPGGGTVYTSWNARVTYVSDNDPTGPGEHTTLYVWLSDWTTQAPTGTTTMTQVQVVQTGYVLNQLGGMMSSWYGSYVQQATPRDPAVGSVAQSLQSAKVSSGLMTFDCETAAYLGGACPATPALISVTGTWRATGPAVQTVTHETDSLGARIATQYRTRTAAATIQFSGGTIPFPPIVKDSAIWYQQETYVP